MDIKKKALFIYPSLSSFIKKDVEILENNFHLVAYEFKPLEKFHTPFLLVHQLFFLLKHFNSKICIIEFAGYHSLIPVVFCKLFRIPTLIICGGNDCHSFPAIRYGNHQKLFLALATRLSLTNCKQISTKDETLWYSDYTYDQRFPSNQGIKAFIPQIKTPNKTIYNGYDEGFWKIGETERKPFSFVTVSGNLHLNFQAELKGIDLIIEAAKQFPSFEFTIVGVTENHQLNITPNNVRLIGPKNAEELRTLYSTHEYYIQLSIAEGFPNSLCEAMLCGCTPIVSNVFSMERIVKNAGFTIHKRDLSQFIEVLNDIKKTHKLEPEVARKNISNYYSIKNRKDQLLELVNKLSN